MSSGRTITAIIAVLALACGSLLDTEESPPRTASPTNDGGVGDGATANGSGAVEAPDLVSGAKRCVDDSVCFGGACVDGRCKPIKAADAALPIVSVALATGKTPRIPDLYFGTEGEIAVARELFTRTEPLVVKGSGLGAMRVRGDRVYFSAGESVLWVAPGQLTSANLVAQLKVVPIDFAMKDDRDLWFADTADVSLVVQGTPATRIVDRGGAGIRAIDLDAQGRPIWTNPTSVWKGEENVGIDISDPCGLVVRPSWIYVETAAGEILRMDPTGVLRVPIYKPAAGELGSCRPIAVSPEENALAFIRDRSVMVVALELSLSSKGGGVTTPRR